MENMPIRVVQTYRHVITAQANPLIDKSEPMGATVVEAASSPVCWFPTEIGVAALIETAAQNISIGE